MADPHQVISIVATAICDVRKDDPDYRMDPEKLNKLRNALLRR
jgi:hypothetical protein